jgi:hypothetical protein
MTAPRNGTGPCATLIAVSAVMAVVRVLCDTTAA